MHVVVIATRDEIETDIRPNAIGTEQQVSEIFCKNSTLERRSDRQIAPAGMRTNASIDHNDI
jgi:hypothetical protein